MKRLFAAIAFLCSLASAPAQEIEPTLTKAQMYSDFNDFYKLIDDYWPQVEIQRLVTGRNIRKELKNMRSEMDTVTCNAGFYDVISRLMFLCNDQHTSFAYHENIYPKERKISSIWNRKYFKYSYLQQLRLNYVDGKYYTRTIVTPAGDVLIPEGAQITAVNGMTIDKYVAEINIKMQNSTLWDWTHKKFYTKDLNNPQSMNAKSEYTWTYAYKGKKQTVNMKGAKIRHNGPLKNYWFFGPIYFERDGILFIRLPEMNVSKAEQLTKDVLKYKTQNIRKIIIDVRGNGGGGDELWERLLSVIIDKDIVAPHSIALKNKGQAEYFRKMDYNATDIVPLVIGTDTLYNYHYDRIIKRNPNSLDFKGKIYVLFDADRCYSSTSSLKSVCNQSDRLVSVGQRSGFLLGSGLTPMPGFLDESKINYRMSCTIETTNARKNHPEDYYQSEVEIPVKMPKYEKYYGIIYNYQDDLYGEEFLYKYDPCFKRVLKESLE